MIDSERLDGLSMDTATAEQEKLRAIFPQCFVDGSAIAGKHSVYDHVLCDSDTIERPFAVTLDYGRFIKHPSEVVAVGDTVKVWVSNIDKERGKIGLTMVEGK